MNVFSDLAEAAVLWNPQAGPTCSPRARVGRWGGQNRKTAPRPDPNQSPAGPAAGTSTSWAQNQVTVCKSSARPMCNVLPSESWRSKWPVGEPGPKVPQHLGTAPPLARPKEQSLVSADQARHTCLLPQPDPRPSQGSL